MAEEDTKRHSVDVAEDSGVKQALNVPETLSHYNQEELDRLEKKLKRRIDLRILPMMVTIYVLNYLDRNNIATARLGGLEESLDLTSAQYQTCVSILFVGYILMQIPSNLFLNYLGKPSIYLTCCMFVWAAISASTAATQNFRGLVCVRFFLGFVEAAYFPGCLFMLSSWYTRKELALRTAVLYSGSLFSGAFGSLLGAAIINNMQGIGGLDSWRWLFIIEGGILTGAIVPLAYFVLPDFPATTKWLSEEERELALWRLRREVGQDDMVNEGDKSMWLGFKLAVSDIKVWLGSGILLFLVAACGVTNFFPTVVGTLNFNTTTTLLLSAPPYMLCVVTTFVNARHADKTCERFFHIVGPMCVAIVAFIISASTLNVAARYFAMMIMLSGLYCAYTVILTWMPNIIPRPASKRAVALALMNGMSDSTSIWNAYLYPTSAEPRFLVAFICNAVFIFCAFLCALALRTVLKRLNRKIDRGELNAYEEFGSAANQDATFQVYRYPY